MQESSGDELLRKLSTTLRKYENAILRGESKLCLTATSVVYLNRCFEQLISGSGQNEAGIHYSNSSSSCVAHLHDLTRRVLSLKLIPGPCARFDILLNISHFKNLQYLEIKKVPLGYILGLQGLRKQLKGLTCMRSAFALNEVFIWCGGDLSSTSFAWQQLQEVNLSYNSIDHLDDAVKVLPVIQVLNLSHNNIESPHEEDCWQFLTGLRYLNLGYNQLNKVPTLPAVSITRFQLKILILRNNNIQNLKGIQHFGLLETLDVSNNCIASFQELFPLAHLHNLSVLHLSGNPVCFGDDYRVEAVSCMSPVPHQGDMYLDNQKLSPLEKSFVGCSVQPASLLSYLPSQPAVLSPRNMTSAADSESITESPQGYVEQSLVVPSPKKKKKGRKLKTRQISIDKDVDEGNSAASSFTSSPAERALEHSQDIERLEKARDLGGEHWLPAVNTVLHGGEKTSSPRQTSSYHEIDVDNGSDTSNTSPYMVSQEHVTVDVNLSLSRKSSSSESYQSDDGINQPFLVTLKALHLPDEEQEYEDDRDLLVTITEHFIRERDCDNGKVICKLEIGSLLAANLEESEDGELVVHLKFDYLSRERRERYYIMEDRQSAEQLIDLLFPMVMSNEESKNVVISEHLQCLKCSAYFTEQTTKSRDQHICPDCGSTQIIEVNPAEKSRDPVIDSPEEKLPVDRRTDVTTGNTWLNEAQKIPDLIPRRAGSPTISPQPDIYSYTKEDTTEKHNLLESKDTKIYTINNTKGFHINDSVKVKVNDSTLNKKEFTSERNPSDVSQKENGISNSPNKTAGYVVYDKKNDYLAKSVSPTRTSALSNSLKKLETKPFVAKSAGNGDLGRTGSQKRIIDSPITLKTSSREHATLEPDSSGLFEEVPSNKRPSTPGQPKIPPSSSPGQPNVFMNLFSKLSNKMSGPLLSSSGGTPSRTTNTPVMSSSLVYDIPPDEFKACDHRLKLYFEVSLFTGGPGEALSCLIKVPVVVYGEPQETCAVLVISTMAVYVCKLVENAGWSAAECLSLISSHSLEDFQYVDFGVGSQSFRMEFTGESPACYTMNVRDQNRCETFLHLLIKTANVYKAKQALDPLKTTRCHPQTLAHIRSQVLGVQEEKLSVVGERFLGQLNDFTEPPLIKDRKSLLRSYPTCFVGKEFIDWLIRCGEVKTRQQGIELAQNLVEGGVIEHVSKESKFEDKEQFYRFIVNDSKRERSDSTEREEDGAREIDMSINDIDTHLSAVIMGYKIQDNTKPLVDLKPVTVIVTRTHIALAEQNPQWPFPRYIESAPTVSGPQFHCIAKYKMTDVSSLEFFSDSPCHVAIVISEEDGPLECADSYVLIKTETTDSLSSIVDAIREPWEEQFGVELLTTCRPSLSSRRY